MNEREVKLGGRLLMMPIFSFIFRQIIIIFEIKFLDFFFVLMKK